MRCLSALPAAAAVLGLAATALFLTAPVASADGLPAPTLSKATAHPGDTFTVSGSGCPLYDPSGGVSVAVNGFGSLVTDPGADGSWSVTMTVGTTFAGSYPIRSTCWRGAQQIDYPTVTIRVDAPPQWWETCGPTGGPVGTSCPRPPTVAAPPPAPRTTTTPRTTAAPAPAVRTTAPPTGTPIPPAPATSVAPTTSTAELAPTPAVGCRDCARLTGGRPVVAGARLALSYAGFQPGERVTVVLHSRPVELGSFVADSSGVVTASVAIPATVEAGSHRFMLTGEQSGDRVVHFRLAAARTTATAAAAGAEGDTSIALPLVGAGAAVVLLGGGGALVVRRRRAAAIG